MNLLVDSTSIKFLGASEWKCKKHSTEYRRQWRKEHLGIYAQTLEIRAIEVTDNRIGDVPISPELLSQIPANEPIVSVRGDDAHDIKASHAVIARRKTHILMPPRESALVWKSTEAGQYRVAKP